jgi:hypothetical protein
MTKKPATLRAAMARQMTEDELLLAITEGATLLGWRWHHFRRSDKGIQMGHAGFPDLVLAKAGRVLFLELKAEIGHLTTDQRLWLEAMPAHTAYLVRPTDLDKVLRVLAGAEPMSEAELFAAYGLDVVEEVDVELILDPYTKAGGFPRPADD